MKASKPFIYYKDSNGCFVCVSHQGRVARIFYKRYIGKIPEGLCVCHSCDNPRCINPKHLWLGTTAENVRDRTLKNRSTSKLTQEQVNSIFTDERTFREIANSYRVNIKTISDIKHRLTWKHLREIK
jgi:uncharacterized protein YfaP (DUF2135 family)